MNNAMCCVLTNMKSVIILMLMFVNHEAAAEVVVTESPLLLQILDSVGTATSNDNLFNVTLKLLESLCVCMQENMRQKKRSHGEVRSLNYGNGPIDLKIYGKMYNSTCFSLWEELTNKLNNSTDLFKDSNSYNRFSCQDLVKITNPKIKEQSDLSNEFKSNRTQILYKMLIETKDRHKYTIKKFNLFGKAKSQVEFKPAHSIIVIFTMFPNNSEAFNENSEITDYELNNTIYNGAVIDINLIDTRFDPKSRESEELAKLHRVFECHLVSLYTFLFESEKNYLTKSFKLVRKKGTIKMYIDVLTITNHPNYITICCDNNILTECKTNLFRRKSDPETFQANTKVKNIPGNYKNTISKIKHLLSLYEEKFKTKASTSNQSKDIYESTDNAYIHASSLKIKADESVDYENTVTEYLVTKTMNTYVNNNYKNLSLVELEEQVTPKIKDDVLTEEVTKTGTGDFTYSKLTIPTPSIELDHYYSKNTVDSSVISIAMNDARVNKDIDESSMTPESKNYVADLNDKTFIILGNTNLSLNKLSEELNNFEKLYKNMNSNISAKGKETTNSMNSTNNITAISSTKPFSKNKDIINSDIKEFSASKNITLLTDISKYSKKYDVFEKNMTTTKYTILPIENANISQIPDTSKFVTRKPHLIPENQTKDYKMLILDNNIDEKKYSSPFLTKNHKAKTKKTYNDLLTSVKETEEDTSSSNSTYSVTTKTILPSDPVISKERETMLINNISMGDIIVKVTPVSQTDYYNIFNNINFRRDTGEQISKAITSEIDTYKSFSKNFHIYDNTSNTDNNITKTIDFSLSKTHTPTKEHVESMTQKYIPSEISTEENKTRVPSNEIEIINYANNMQINFDTDLLNTNDMITLKPTSKHFSSTTEMYSLLKNTNIYDKNNISGTYSSSATYVEEKEPQNNQNYKAPISVIINIEGVSPLIRVLNYTPLNNSELQVIDKNKLNNNHSLKLLPNKVTYRKKNLESTKVDKEIPMVTITPINEFHNYYDETTLKTFTTHNTILSNNNNNISNLVIVEELTNATFLPNSSVDSSYNNLNQHKKETNMTNFNMKIIGKVKKYLGKTIPITSLKNLNTSKIPENSTQIPMKKVNYYFKVIDDIETTTSYSTIYTIPNLSIRSTFKNNLSESHTIVTESVNYTDMLFTEHVGSDVNIANTKNVTTNYITEQYTNYFKAEVFEKLDINKSNEINIKNNMPHELKVTINKTEMKYDILDGKEPDKVLQLKDEYRVNRLNSSYFETNTTSNIVDKNYTQTTDSAILSSKTLLKRPFEELIKRKSGIKQSNPQSTSLDTSDVMALKIESIHNVTENDNRILLKQGVGNNSSVQLIQEKNTNLNNAKPNKLITYHKNTALVKSVHPFETEDISETSIPKTVDQHENWSDNLTFPHNYINKVNQSNTTFSENSIYEHLTNKSRHGSENEIKPPLNSNKNEPYLSVESMTESTDHYILNSNTIKSLNHSMSTLYLFNNEKSEYINLTTVLNDPKNVGKTVGIDIVNIAAINNESKIGGPTKYITTNVKNVVSPIDEYNFQRNMITNQVNIPSKTIQHNHGSPIKIKHTTEHLDYKKLITGIITNTVTVNNYLMEKYPATIKTIEVIEENEINRQNSLFIQVNPDNKLEHPVQQVNESNIINITSSTNHNTARNTSGDIQNTTNDTLSNNKKEIRDFTIFPFQYEKNNSTKIMFGKENQNTYNILLYPYDTATTTTQKNIQDEIAHLKSQTILKDTHFDVYKKNYLQIKNNNDYKTSNNVMIPQTKRAEVITVTPLTDIFTDNYSNFDVSKNNISIVTNMDDNSDNVQNLHYITTLSESYDYINSTPPYNFIEIHNNMNSKNVSTTENIELEYQKLTVSNNKTKETEINKNKSVLRNMKQAQIFTENDHSDLYVNYTTLPTSNFVINNINHEYSSINFHTIKSTEKDLSLQKESSQSLDVVDVKMDSKSSLKINKNSNMNVKYSGKDLLTTDILNGYEKINAYGSKLTKYVNEMLNEKAASPFLSSVDHLISILNETSSANLPQQIMYPTTLDLEYNIETDRSLATTYTPSFLSLSYNKVLDDDSYENVPIKLKNYVNNTNYLNNLYDPKNIVQTVLTTPSTTITTKTVKYNTYEPTRDFDLPMDHTVLQMNMAQYTNKNTNNNFINFEENVITNPVRSNLVTPQSGKKNLRTNNIRLQINKYNTKLYPIEMISGKTQRKVLRRINLSNKKLMGIKSNTLFSQKRFVTQNNLIQNIIPLPKPLYQRNTPRHSNTISQHRTITKPKEYFRPKPLLIKNDNDGKLYNGDFRVDHKSAGVYWKENNGFFRNTSPNKFMSNYENVADRPLVKQKFFKDRFDSIKNYLLNSEFVKSTKRPPFLRDYFLPFRTEEESEPIPSVFDYRRNSWNKLTTYKPQRTPRKKRTMFFLSPTVVDWWLDDMYMKVRLPLPINSNPGMVFPKRHFAKMEEVADLGALFIDDLLDYKEMLDRGELPLERATNREKGQPLCMEQFYRLLGVCRIPEVGRDRLEFPSVKNKGEESEELVVVACRNYFYPIPVKAADRGRLTPGEIQAQLLHAMVDAGGAPLAPRVGLLTSMNRDQWAKAREQLIKDENNRGNLELISRALCILCLDEAGGDRPDVDADTNAMLRAMHGAGTKHHSANRWFDKTVQLIISSDGTVGMCYEHSAAEGVAVVRLAERALARAEVADRPAPPPALLPAPQAMKWNLSSDIQRTIEQAARDLDRAISDLDFEVYTYKGYGREFMKSCKTSPDVYIQLAIQYAYYKMYGYLVSTYESASLRRFRNGRVDNIRSAHACARAWAAAMCTADASPLNDVDDSQRKVSFNLYGEQKKLELFEEAARKQTAIMEANILGRGIDNHLLGLREGAREALGELPPVFKDDSYTQMFQFKMSTSQVATTTEGTFMGYGAVIPDGYGCCYNPKKESVIFCIASFTSSSVTNTEAFRQSLEEALDSMKLMFQARKVEN